MPVENKSRTTVSKPLTPTLSSNLRTRPAFAPRLAGAGPTSPAANSPRSLRQQTLSPERYEEDRTTSLNSNITPRSGARASRVGTESPSTPDASARTRVAAAGNQEEVQHRNQGLGIASPITTPTHARPRSSELPSMLPTARRVSGGSVVSQSKEDAKFFRANDVRGTAGAAKTNSSRPKSAYISGLQGLRTSPKKTPTEANERLDDKFFYANNISTSNTIRPKASIIAKSSTSPSTALSTRSLPVQSSSHSHTANRSPTQNPAPRSTQSSTSQTSRQRSASSTQSIPNSLERRRSSSLNIKPLIGDSGKGHRKSLSTNSVTVMPLNTEVSGESSKTPKSAHFHSTSVSNLTVLSSDTSSPRSTSLTSALTTNTSVTSEAAKSESQPPIRPVIHARHTRGSSESTHIQPVTQAQIEAAANARRERKVLDLEISNSSLLAINRTLEKELRKQNAELRRFRRLSRSGRLSLTPSYRVVSGASMLTLSTLNEDDQSSPQVALSPGSSDGGSLEEEDYPSHDDDNDSSFTESSDVARRRARDEKRLIQDLQRHQQILLDSQKLTQSIQRCLNCTDELIREGNAALAYQVGANEVQIGGRVLNHDEDDDDDDEALSEVNFSEYTQSMSRPRQGLLSPSTTLDSAAQAAMWVKGLQDTNKLGSPTAPLLQESTDSPSPMLSPIILPGR